MGGWGGGGCAWASAGWGCYVERMLPDRVVLRNYRSFVDRAVLHLRPVTLIFGPNNVGKSSLTRALPLLADSMGSTGPDALNTEARLGDFELSFDTLRWRGSRAESGESVGLGLEWSAGPVRACNWEIWEMPDWRRMLVQALEVVGPAGSHSLRWKPVRGEDRARALTYSLDAVERKVQFAGLQVKDLGADEPPLLQALGVELEAFGRGVQWLRAQRPPPRRRVAVTGGARWELKPDGSDAAVVLAGEDDVLREVQAWYREKLKLELVVQRGKVDVTVEVMPLQGGGMRVDMADAGEGLGQLLPVLTALAMVRQHEARSGPALLCIEEPEAHLHPTTQSALAERVCEVAATPGVRVVLETHALQVLLAVQVAVASGKLPPEAVAVHWVRQLDDGRSRVDLIGLDEKARFVGRWPPDAFSEDLRLAESLQAWREGSADG